MPCGDFGVDAVIAEDACAVPGGDFGVHVAIVEDACVVPGCA